MNDLDLLLSLVENPTRRRILELISQEPSYPLRLSRELGVSTQAVMKNLALLERGGVVERTEAKSDMGPNRALYSPSREFTLVVDMRGGGFSARLVESGPSAEGLEEKLREIDARLGELDRERSALLGERERIESELRRSAEGGEGDGI